MVMGDDLSTCGEWADRDTLELPGLQLELIRAVIETNTPVVLVLVNGRPVTFGHNNSLLGKLSAVLTAGRPGQMGGAAVADILLGGSGKLAASWGRSVGHVGSGSNPFLQPVVGKLQTTSVSPSMRMGVTTIATSAGRWRSMRARVLLWTRTLSYVSSWMSQT